VNTDIHNKAVQIARRWKGVPGMVIGAMQELQDTFGYLPEEGLDALAAALSIPLSQLFSVATFFAFFRTTPRGEHHVQVCDGTACHVLGAEQLGARLARDLGIEGKDPGKDRGFSMEKVRCLGCCSMAPAVRIDDRTFGRINQRNLTKLLKPYRSKETSGEDQKQ
jgi:NADH-quinone oxidoreductase subunit E